MLSTETNFSTLGITATVFEDRIARLGETDPQAREFRLSPATSSLLTYFNKDVTESVLSFFTSLDFYQETPLIKLDALAAHFDLGAISIKDESHRFNERAFKITGGLFSVTQALARHLGLREKIDFSQQSEKQQDSALPNNWASVTEVKTAIQSLADSGNELPTVITATDGNHGRGVAFACQLLGVTAIVLLPVGTAIQRVKLIEGLGGDASVTTVNYDDTVEQAARIAGENNYLLVQDTAWHGYTEIPMFIMQGYSCISREVLNRFYSSYSPLPQQQQQQQQQQLQQKCNHHYHPTQFPTHVFVQCGVGSFATSVLATFINVLKEEYNAKMKINKKEEKSYNDDCKHTFSSCSPLPIFILLESSAADCIRQTAVNKILTIVKGNLTTMQAGLACGVPTTCGLDLLLEMADAFISVSDEVVGDGIRITANNLAKDTKIESGESGAAVGIGVLSRIMMKPLLEDLRISLKLGKESHVLLFNTEGITDEENYRSVLWFGGP